MLLHGSLASEGHRGSMIIAIGKLKVEVDEARSFPPAFDPFFQRLEASPLAGV